MAVLEEMVEVFVYLYISLRAYLLQECEVGHGVYLCVFVATESEDGAFYFGEILSRVETDEVGEPC